MADAGRRGGLRRTPGGSRQRLAALVAVGWLLGGCAVPFGQPPEGSEPQDRRRQGNRLYLEEQERIERGRQLGDPLPSDR